VTDEQLARDVTDELHWDPKVDGRAVAVSATAGIVTLRGTVGSPWEKREATKATQRIRGVLGIDDRLEVRLLDDDRLEDADLRGDVLQALMLDSCVPTSVEATVKDGVVTLSGPVDWRYQRDEAETVAGKVFGVVGVQNYLVLNRPGVRIDPAEIEGGIRKALVRDARLEADGIQVTTADSTVTLSGWVNSWEQHKAALDTAWAAPGVQVVDARLSITY
jgi:osmotically-inducible protein OsmY